VVVANAANGESYAGIITEVRQSEPPVYYIYSASNYGLWYQRKDFRITHKGEEKA